MSWITSHFCLWISKSKLCHKPGQALWAEWAAYTGQAQAEALVYITLKDWGAITRKFHYTDLRRCETWAALNANSFTCQPKHGPVATVNHSQSRDSADKIVKHFGQKTRDQIELKREKMNMIEKCRSRLSHLNWKAINCEAFERQMLRIRNVINLNVFSLFFFSTWFISCGSCDYQIAKLTQISSVSAENFISKKNVQASLIQF